MKNKQFLSFVGRRRGHPAVDYTTVWPRDRALCEVMTADYCFTSCVLEAIKRMPTIQRLTRSLKSVYRFCWQSLQEGGLGAQQVWGGVVWCVSLYCFQMAVVVPIFMLALLNAYLSNDTTRKLSEVDKILPSLYGQSRELGWVHLSTFNSLPSIAKHYQEILYFFLI